MRKKPENEKLVNVSVAMHPTLVQRLDAIADDSDRSRSNVAVRLITLGLQTAERKADRRAKC